MLPRALLLISLGVAVATAAVAYPNEEYVNYRPSTRANHTSLFCFLNATSIAKRPQFNLRGLRLELCSHIVYGAAELDNRNWEIRAVNSDLEQHSSVSENMISFDSLLQLKKQRGSDLKVIISVRGSNADYSNMAQNHRAEFIKSVVNFFNKHHFDGLNIDWQNSSPGSSYNPGANDDKHNFSTLMKELKSELRTNGRMLTTFISKIRQNIADSLFTDTDLMEYVDNWIIYSVEYYGHFSSSIGANAPIRSRERLNVEKTIDDLKALFHNHAYKLVLTVPFYGKKFQLRDKLHSNESPLNKAFINSYSHIDTSMLSYREICQKMAKESWQRGWDWEAQVPYIVKDTSVIVYDDAQSVAAKTNLAIKKGLMGVMAYSIDMDDYIGDCADRQTTSENYNYQYNYNNQDKSARKFPLLQSMYDTIERGSNSADLQSSPLALILAVSGAMLLKVLG